jgi:hypothetical protein
VSDIFDKIFYQFAFEMPLRNLIAAVIVAYMMLISSLAYTSSLMTAATFFTKTSVEFHQTKRCYIAAIIKPFCDIRALLLAQVIFPLSEIAPQFPL